jgi:hypothetical protein
MAESANRIIQLTEEKKKEEKEKPIAKITTK